MSYDPRDLKALDQIRKENPLYFYEPHGKQRIFHGSPLKLRAFLGGNRAGKTTCGIADDLIQAVDEKILPDHLKPYKRWDPPCHIRVVTPDFTSTMEGAVYEKLREWAPKSQLKGGSWEKAYDKQRRRLWFENGSWFDFLTYEQDLDKFGGVALNRVHFDEEPPGLKGQQIFRESRVRLIDYGGEVVFTMTPLLGLSWTFATFFDGRDERGEPKPRDGWTVVRASMDDNPLLGTAEKAAALEDMTDEERAARVEGRYVHFHGLIYPEFDRHRHVIPQRAPDPENSIVVGIDPGIRHAAGVVWAEFDPDNVMTVFDCLKVQGATIAEVAAEIHLRNERWGVNPRYIIDPAARNKAHQTGLSDQQVFADCGILAAPGNHAVRPGISEVRTRLQRDLLKVTANSEDFIAEMELYRWSVPRTIEEDPREKPVKRDDHTVDSARYIAMSRPVLPTREVAEQYLTPAQRAMRDELDRFDTPTPAGPVGAGQFA